MTIGEFLDMLDGRGIVYEDEDLVMQTLWEYGMAIFDEITITTPGGTVLLGDGHE